MKSVFCLLAASLFIGSHAQAASNNQWEIDSKHSMATFTVKHMMVSNVPGQMAGVKGNVDFDGKNVDSLKVSATLDPATINTGEPDRDEHLRGADFFDVKKYPSVTFESDGVIPVMKGGFKLSGKLTLHGVTKNVELNVDGPTEPIKDTNRGIEKIGATATTSINRKDFGITYNKTLDNGGVAISDEVKITLELEMSRPLKVGNK
ncbi:MAG: YceI family protein [Candidatus Obscuribacterales bacterium]|nr:YceI family protein [Candidatus Obscuribacterales bacterium]